MQENNIEWKWKWKEEEEKTLQSGAQLDVSKPHWPEYYNVYVYESHFFKAYKIFQIKYEIFQISDGPAQSPRQSRRCLLKIPPDQH